MLGTIYRVVVKYFPPHDYIALNLLCMRFLYLKSPCNMELTHLHSELQLERDAW